MFNNLSDKLDKALHTLKGHVLYLCFKKEDKLCLII